jgi:hypothetical protein
MLLWLAGFTQHPDDETKQLLQRGKSRRLVRGNMLNLTLESTRVDVGFGSKLNNESKAVVRSFHPGRRIGQRYILSHKSEVNFR